MSQEYFSESAAVFITDTVGDFIEGELPGLQHLFGCLNPDPLQINQRGVSGPRLEPALECPPAHPESACQLLIGIVLIQIFLHQFLRGQYLWIVVVLLKLKDGVRGLKGASDIGDHGL